MRNPDILKDFFEKNLIDLRDKQPLINIVHSGILDKALKGTLNEGLNPNIGSIRRNTLGSTKTVNSGSSEFVVNPAQPEFYTEKFYYDGLGREYKSIRKHLVNTKEFNRAGLVSRVSTPTTIKYTTNSTNICDPAYYTNYEYDEAGRLVKKILPDDTVAVEYSYSGEDGKTANMPMPMLDTFSVANPRALYSGTSNAGYRGKKNNNQIDYIFVPRETTVIGSRIIYYNVHGSYPSDHFPLLSEIELK